MTYPDGRKYTKDHEWIEVAGDRGRVGITDFAQQQLGDVVYVQVPPVGAAVKAGESFSEIESTKSVSDIYAPVSGSIVEVNADLADAPQRINEDPYGEGWLCVLEMADSAELDALLDADGYRALVES